MKFNLKKWQMLQDRKQDLHGKLMSIQDILESTKNEYARQEQNVIRNYDTNRNLSLKAAILSDRKLSYAQLLDRAHAIKTQWKSICPELGLNQEKTLAHLPIQKLYDQMLGLKQLEERFDAAYKDFQNHGQCFNALEEYAGHHAKIDLSALYPVGETTGSSLSSEPYPMA
jgi:hypothetical protein